MSRPPPTALHSSRPLSVVRSTPFAPVPPTIKWPGRVPYLVGDMPPGTGERRAVADNSEIQVMLNGAPASGRNAASATLLDWLRDEAGLTGTKEGCAEGECGACTVQLDGDAVMACLVPAAQVDGHSVATVESMADPDGTPHAIQQAFVDECGAVRFLYPRFHRGVGQPPGRDPRPDRRRHPARALRQPVPLHWLLPDHAGGRRAGVVPVELDESVFG